MSEPANKADDAGAKAMDQLTARWYNTITSALNLDSERFQIAQASEPLVPDTMDMWARFNSVPPKSIAQKYDSSEMNDFAKEYKGLVSALQPTGQDTESFRTLLGDNYQVWRKYKQNHIDEIGEKGVVAVFNNWATVYLDPADRSKAVSYLNRMENSPVMKAVKDVGNPEYYTTFEKPVGDKQVPVTKPNFDKTFDDLKTVLDSGSSMSFEFDSETASTDVSHTWADGNVRGCFRSFFAGAGGTSEELTKKVSDEKLTLKGSFKHVARLSASPGNWFDVTVLKHAYSEKDGDIWAEKKWDDYFGNDGSLKRLMTTLIVVDGLHFKMESEAEFSEKEQEHVTNSIESGFWPFFSVTTTYEKDVTHTFDDSGRLTVEFGPTPTGRPLLLGVNVESIGDL